MCVIVHVPAGIQPEEELLKKCYDANSHGWGIMFAYQGELISFKDKSSFEDFLKFWESTPTDVDRFAHFRIKTHGETNAENCHPFVVNTGEQEHLMMHNGIVDVSEVDSDHSDSWHFSKLLSGMYQGVKDFLDSDVAQKNIAKATAGSRFVFLRGDGQWYKFGTWQEKNGMSFSNLNFDTVRSFVAGSSGIGRWYAGVYNDQWWDDEMYDRWGNYVGPDPERPGDTKEVLKITGTGRDDDDYMMDTFEEGVSRIDEAIEDGDLDDAISLCQFHEFKSSDIKGWFGDCAVMDILDHILTAYTFKHSSDKGGKK